MEEIKSTKARQISKTSNVKLSKFTFFDKCKYADVNSSKNSSPSVHTKSRERTEGKNDVHAKNLEHSPDSAQSNQELQHPASQFTGTDNKASGKIQENSFESSSDWIRVIDDSDSTVSCLESERELAGPLKFETSVRHKSCSSVIPEMQKVGEKLIIRDISEQSLLLQYLKCSNALKLGLMNLVYSVFEDFRVPQSGQHEKAKFAIMIDETYIMEIKNYIQKSKIRLDDIRTKNKQTPLRLNDKVTNKINLCSMKRKRVGKKAISNIIGSVDLKNSIKCRNFELPPRSRNNNSHINTQCKEKSKSSTILKSASCLKGSIIVNESKNINVKSDFLPNILRLKSHTKCLTKNSFSQNLLRNFHKSSQVALDTNSIKDSLNKVCIKGGEAKFLISRKQKVRRCLHITDKGQVKSQKNISLRCQSCAFDLSRKNSKLSPIKTHYTNKFECK